MFLTLVILKDDNILITLGNKLLEIFSLPVSDWPDHSQKLGIIGISYPPLVVFLSSLGFFYFLVYKREQLYLPLIISFILFIFFMKLNASYRVLTSIAPFVSYIAAYSIITIQKYLFNKRIFKILILWLLFVSLITSLIGITLTIQIAAASVVGEKNPISFYDLYEYNAARWLELNNITKDTYVISDPWTSLVMRGISGVYYLESNCIGKTRLGSM